VDKTCDRFFRDDHIISANENGEALLGQETVLACTGYCWDTKTGTRPKRFILEDEQSGEKIAHSAICLFTKGRRGNRHVPEPTPSDFRVQQNSSLPVQTC
jgi:hypothetical protein